MRRPGFGRFGRLGFGGGGGLLAGARNLPLGECAAASYYKHYKNGDNPFHTALKILAADRTDVETVGSTGATFPMGPITKIYL